MAPDTGLWHHGLMDDDLDVLIIGSGVAGLSLAAALAHGPAAVLADEPTVGQDRGTWAAVVGLLLAHRARGGAVVTATHDADLMALVDEVREVRLAAGAGFVVFVCGSLMTMPGLPKKPAALAIDVDSEGRITGLF